MAEENVPPAPKKKRSKKELVETPLHVLPGNTKVEQLQKLYDQWYGCQRCLLAQFRKDGNGVPTNDVVFADGNPDAKIMIVGEAPGEEEDACGIPFIGPSGRLLNQILATVSDDPGIQELYRWYNTSRHTQENQDWFHKKMLEWRQHEFFITNVVACRPPDNRQPTTPEVKACWERLYNIIYVVDPWLIIASGKVAMGALVKKQVEITKKHGEIFDVEIRGRVTTYKKPVMPTLHPSYLLRQADWRNKNGTYMQTLRDYREAMLFFDRQRQLHLGTPLPQRPELPTPP